MSEWVVGRAGMLYRDLLPDHAGGALLANRIRIPEGGDVGDWVHFHEVALQTIFVLEGRVKLVYEDQGEPFWAGPGDCILQAPTIRHRVLETEAGLEVLELVSPAEHTTRADPQMALPTGRLLPERSYGGGQRFLWDRADQASWRGQRVRVRVLGVSASGAPGWMAVMRGSGSTGELDHDGVQVAYIWEGAMSVGDRRYEAGSLARFAGRAEATLHQAAVVWAQLARP